jgi:hypothetical protein
MVKCEQELHTQVYLGVPTGKNPEDSSPVSVEAMQWVLLYLSIGHDIENILHSAATMCRSTIMRVEKLLVASCICSVGITTGWTARV